eukprot:8691199-Karenia_brevis.AAC.1
MEEDARRRDKKSKKGGMSKDEREQRVSKLAGLGRISKAIQAIISPGLAADTPSVQRKLAAKFPRRSYAVEPGRVLPEATAAGVEDFIEQVKGFKVGAGPGPSGLRPQFLKEMVGEDGDDPCVDAMYRVTMLFVEGRVPRYLRRWYGGGGLVGI